MKAVFYYKREYKEMLCNSIKDKVIFIKLTADDCMFLQEKKDS